MNTPPFPFREMVPTREQFDAMNDCAFCDWWDAFEERVQAQADAEFQVQQVSDARKAAETARWSDAA